MNFPMGGSDSTFYFVIDRQIQQNACFGIQRMEQTIVECCIQPLDLTTPDHL